MLEPYEAETAGRILELTVLTLLPYSLIAPFLGVFVDRWQRRRLLVWTNVLRGIFLTTLPLWALALPGNYGLYVSQVLLLGFGRLFLTTKGAVLPAVLHEHHLLRGNSVSGGGGMIAALVGGVAGVGAVGAFDENWAFVFSGIAYLFAASIVQRLSEPYAAPHTSTEAIGEAFARIVKELLEGLRAVRERIRVSIPLIGIFLLRTIGIIVAIGAILVIKAEFPDEGERAERLRAAALSLGSTGVGAFVGALTAPFLGRRYVKPQLILIGFVVSGLGIMALGGISNIPAVLALTFFGGYGGFITKVAVDASLQEALPDYLRGRVFALYDVLYNLASVAAALLMFSFQNFDLRTVLVVSGAVALALAMILATVMSRAGMLSHRLTPEEIADV